jgi:hypothetical protein
MATKEMTRVSQMARAAISMIDADVTKCARASLPETRTESARKGWGQMSIAFSTCPVIFLGTVLILFSR